MSGEAPSTPTPTRSSGSDSSSLTPALSEMSVKKENKSKSRSELHLHINGGSSSGSSSSSSRAANNRRVIELAENAIRSGALSTAVLLAEQLGTASNASSEEVALLARTYFLSGEPRRCVSLLEQRELLSVMSLDIVSKYLICICTGTLNTNNDFANSDAESRVNALILAGQSLLQLNRIDDCITLLLGVVKTVDNAIGDLSQLKPVPESNQIHPLACLNSIIGRSLDAAENRTDAIKYLKRAIIIDVACLEAVEYLINTGLLSSIEKRSLFNLIKFTGDREQFETVYKILLKNEFTAAAKQPENILETPGSGEAEASVDTGVDMRSGPMLIRQAEHFYNNQRSDEAYKLAVKAYHMDPFDLRCLVIYIATLVDLGFKNELFYLGHELTASNPNSAIAWYAVGCYYYCCGKYDLAHKHLAKSTKINKRFVYSWIALGNVFSAQDESEHAVTVYRTAMRSAPGDFRPMLLLAKELSRGNNFSMALQILSNCVRAEPGDPVVLNEMGVVLLKLERNQEACNYLHAATTLLTSKLGAINEQNLNNAFGGGLGSNKLLPSKHYALEILNNYAVALRRLRNYKGALEYFSLCMSMNPLDPEIHLAIAFTYHLDRLFDEAITYYHRSLALKSNNSFCIEMLHRAMVDKEQFYENSISNSFESKLNAGIQDSSFGGMNNNSTILFSGSTRFEDLQEYEDTSMSNDM